LWEDHRVFARHGEVYDPVNYEADGMASLGDAIVIDLLSRFSEEIKKEFGGADAGGILNEIAEIDNVRPLIDIPAYINGVCRKHGGDPVVRRVKKGLGQTGGRIVRSDIISKRDKILKWDHCKHSESGAVPHTAFLKRTNRRHAVESAAARCICRRNLSRKESCIGKRNQGRQG